MRNACIALSIVAVIGLFAAPVLAGGATDVLCKCQVENLGLDEAQVKKLDALRAKIMKRVEPAMKNLEKRRAEMLKLWQAKNPRRKAILAKHNQMDRIRKQLRTAKLDAALGLLKICNDEQKGKLKEKWSKMHEAKAKAGGCCAGDAKAHPEGCDCPGCKKKAAGEEKPATPAAPAGTEKKAAPAKAK